MNGLARPTAPQGGRFDLSPSASSASASPASSEARLFDAYRGARSPIEELPCVCGGMVRANPESPATGVQAHNYTARHRAWRMNREDA